jgi:hypothetical protein
MSMRRALKLPKIELLLSIDDQLVSRIRNNKLWIGARDKAVETNERMPSSCCCRHAAIAAAKGSVVSHY